MFKLVKKGYDTFEVEREISRLGQLVANLKTANSELKLQLDDILAQKQLIESQLDSARSQLEKAEEGEREAKKVMELEGARLNAVVEKWKNTMTEIRLKYGIKSEEELSAEKLKDDIESIVTGKALPDIDADARYDYLTSPSDKYYHRRLLNRMSGLLYNATSKQKEGLNAQAGELEKQERELFEHEKNLLKEVEKARGEKNSTEERIKTVFSEEPMNSYANLLDKYLNEDNDSVANTYSASIEVFEEESTPAFGPSEYPTPNESGFDLREAVNPTDSLEDIMGAFDFYSPEGGKTTRK